MKKAGIIVLGCGILAAGVTTGVFLSLPKEEIVLTIENGKLSWIDNSKDNLVNSFYHIYNDDFLVNKVTEHSYMLNDERLIDEAGPSKIKKVNVVYKGDLVSFEWEDAEDLGTDNNIQVNLYDEKDKLKSFSNIVNQNFTSGISKYIVEFKGENFEIWDNKFSVKISDLKDGITTIKLYAIDNRGNKGAMVSVPLYNYKVILSRENDLLRFSIDDDTQKYSYKAIINGKDAGYIQSNSELNDLLVDNKAPKAPSDVRIMSSDKMTNIRWSGCSDVGNTYTVKIIASGLSYYNNASSDEVSIEKKSDIKGYYYAINNTKNYTISDKDTFTIKTDLDYMDDYGVYYFHVATVDNVGNISETKTYKFEKKDISLIEDDKNSNSVGNSGSNNSNNNSNNNNGNIQIKPPTSSESSNNSSEFDKKVKNIIRRVGNVSTDNYNKAVNILRIVPEKIIDYMNNKDICIYITTGEAEVLYKTFTGKEADKSITGAFVWGNSVTAVVCESAYMDSTLLHEVGHAFDFICGNGKFISSSEEFKSIFNSEKYNIFSSGEYYTSSENEYFAESLCLYYKDNSKLKKNAPQTYKFIEKYLTKYT